MRERVGFGERSRERAQGKNREIKREIERAKESERKEIKSREPEQG